MNEILESWPLCPNCQRPRHTWCPICETAGHDFPQGDQFTMEDDEERRAKPSLLLICPTCDEPFKPRFLRHCEWCNHDFGNGHEHAPTKVVVHERVEFNMRAALVGVAIVAAIGAILLYFRHILSR